MGAETILVVEDEEQTREVIRRVLEGEGYTVLLAGHPDEAEQLFDARKGAIDLLLTDVVLPGGDGPDLYRRLSEKRIADQKAVRVLYMSGYTHTLARRRHLLEGNPDFLEKPFTPEGLAQRVKKALAADLKERPQGRTILVVEDDQQVRKVVQRTLEGAGHKLLLAANPDEAEKLFQQHEDEIGLLLTDVVLPGGDGPDLYQRFSEKKAIKVLYMSGFTHTMSSRKHLLEGNPDFLEKPFTPEQLLEKVNELI